MGESVHSVITPQVPAPDRRIEVRLARPAPQVRFEKGKKVTEPMPDPERLLAALRRELEREVQATYGERTELVLSLSGAPGIRTQGSFQEKASVTRERVEGWLALAFEGLELE